MKAKIFFKAALALAVMGTFASCNDYLDKQPLDKVTPEGYFNQESHLEAYANNRYASVLPSSGNWSYGIYGGDQNTDNMVSNRASSIYLIGEWRTSMSESGYDFTQINSINYFFDVVLPKYEKGEIQGSDANIRHYIGEMYFMRAYTYYGLMVKYGDFPIIEECLPDDLEVLSAASERHPMNEVARFILSDLDKAYDYMKDTPMARTRLNADVARLIKSRVALYTGTWLKNFAGTPFVPNGEGWPGKEKSYNANYQFPTGSLDDEANWFLEQAIAAAKEVGDAAELIPNTGVVPQTEGASIDALENENRYLAMFGTLDLSSYKEVMLWRQYSRGLGIVHNIVVMAQHGNYACGITRSMVDAFVMKDGLPIYASPLYAGDETLTKVRQDRDPRLFVFLKEPGQKNVLVFDGGGDHMVPVEPYPQILDSAWEQLYSTGYALRKGNYYASSMADNGNNYTACPVFRSVEALLNYIEAYYERYGSLDGTATEYWKKIRARHNGLDTDFQKTINATDMTKEALTDWGAYTAGVVIDPVRYNIRRERRCELMAETFRWNDLKRWRAMDQLITNKYHVEGFHIWGTPMQDWYDQDELKAAISSPDRSEYLRPFEAQTNGLAYDGITWVMAHYLDPMPIYQMMLTSPDHTSVADSPIYQNPYWPTEANMPATK